MERLNKFFFGGGYMMNGDGKVWLFYPDNEAEYGSTGVPLKPSCLPNCLHRKEAREQGFDCHEVCGRYKKQEIAWREYRDGPLCVEKRALRDVGNMMARRVERYRKRMK